MMQAILRRTAAVVTLLMMASAAPVSPCKQGSGIADGVCKELAEEHGPGVVELLQKRADRAPPLGSTAPLAAAEGSNTSAGSVPSISLAASKAVANVSANASSNTSAAFPPIPGIISNLVPSQVTDALNQAAVQGFITGLNATLNQLDTEAQEFLARASQYRDALLLNVSASGERSIEALEELVLANTDPIAWSFGAIVETVNTAVPTIATVVSSLGLSSIASSIQANTDKVRSVAQTILDQLHSASDDVAMVGNASVAELDAKLAALNATSEAGLAAARDFEQQLTTTLQGLIEEVAAQLGIEISSAQTASQSSQQLESLIQMVQQLLGELSQGVQDVFTGTNQAAVTAVETERRAKSGAEGLRLPAMALLVVAVLGSI